MQTNEDIAAAAGRRRLEELREKRALEKMARGGGAPHPSFPGPVLSNSGSPPAPGDAGVYDDAQGDMVGVPELWARIQYLEAELRTAQGDAGQAHAAYVEERKARQALTTETSGLREQARSAEGLVAQLEERRRQLAQAEDQIADLRTSLETVTLERDAALVAKEDFSQQLRLAKRRLQEAEEEQLKAEEDTAALRAELERLQHAHEADAVAAGGGAGGGALAEALRRVEQERDSAVLEAKDLSAALVAEQQRGASERQRNAVERRDLEAALAQARGHLRDTMERGQGADMAMSEASAAVPRSPLVPMERKHSRRASEIEELKEGTAEATGPQEPSPELLALKSEVEKLKVDVVTRDKKLRELAGMVERLEMGRQKLLTEVDAQSLEIERLFMENGRLAEALQESSDISGQWEVQVRAALAQNTELRRHLSRLAEAQLFVASKAQGEAEAMAMGGGAESGAAGGEGGVPVAVEKESSSLNGTAEVEQLKAEKTKLMVELIQSITTAEDLSGQLAQLSADYTRALQSLAGIGRLYKPVLSSIESRLLQIKQDAPLPLRI